jgi:hypothetical protein
MGIRFCLRVLPLPLITFVVATPVPAAEPGDVGSAECAALQRSIQDDVGDETPEVYPTHGGYVRKAAGLARQAVEDQVITAECATCIVSQFARSVPIDEQEPCGCIDADADGFGTPGSPLCRKFEEDCNDANGAINPGAREICGDGIDNNCDKITDGKDSNGIAVQEIPDGADDNCDGGAEPEIVSGCATDEWLCRRLEGNDASAEAYYQAIAAPETFSEWKSRFGFGRGSDEDRIRAFYYNEFDLRLGREMNCTRNSPSSPETWRVACYVTNYGRLGPGSPPEGALHDVVRLQNQVASVGMVYDPGASAAEGVQFYVYGINTDEENFVLQKQVPLDSEANKAVPEICLPCHGGVRNSNNKVSGASFLPLDLDAFLYSQESRFTLERQEEAFRRLNQVVKETDPTPAIRELIDGWYDGAVEDPHTPFDRNFVPMGWQAVPFVPPQQDPQTLYKTIVQPYCRGCHVALSSQPNSALDFDAYSDLVFYRAVGLLESDACRAYSMPHAEVSLARFWASPSTAKFLGDFVGPMWPPINTCVVTPP